MIEITRLNGKKFVINAELIESVEDNPDTLITLTTGRKILVTESVDEIVDKVHLYKRKVYSNLLGVE